MEGWWFGGDLRWLLFPSSAYFLLSCGLLVCSIVSVFEHEYLHSKGKIEVGSRLSRKVNCLFHFVRMQR